MHIESHQTSLMRCDDDDAIRINSPEGILSSTLLHADGQKPTPTHTHTAPIKSQACPSKPHSYRDFRFLNIFVSSKTQVTASTGACFCIANRIRNAKYVLTAILFSTVSASGRFLADCSLCGSPCLSRIDPRWVDRVYTPKWSFSSCL